MKTTIIGCGYIGLALAEMLHQKHHFLTCTTINPKSIKKLKKTTQKSLIMRGTDKNEVSLILENNDTIIVTVEAKNSDEFENTYLQTAHTIKECAKEIEAPKKIIFTSKTSVYGNHDGMWVDESAPLKAKDEFAKILIDTENTISSLNDFGWSVAILRLTQVYGGENHEIIDLFKESYKNVLPGHSDYYTNMVHRDDVVGIISYLIDHDIRGIYNVSDDEHPTRDEFSKKICAKLNLDLPKYDPTLADFPDNNKRVANYRIKEKGYLFKHPHRAI
jgi:nucleoside-diphosphate-sugar epimerase